MTIATSSRTGVAPMGMLADRRPRLPGAPGARLLAGPDGTTAERWSEHVRRLGPLDATDGRPLLAELDASGLTGRGGGAFPTVRKIEACLGAPGEALVVVNASEGEPASAKDAALWRLRPQLVLDGAEAAAALTGATEIVVYGHVATAVLVHLALSERPPGAVRWRVAVAPDTYVAGESSAVASFVTGGPALPRVARGPVAAGGVGGRPVLVSNTETFAHLGLIARFGASWWRTAGSPVGPGSRLVTAAGGVHRPGLVTEVVEPVPVGAVLTEAGVDARPAAVLVGGYSGRWLDGATAWDVPFEVGDLAAVGASPGCGVIASMPAGACPLVEVARLATYLAGQSAGQCGPCVFGLAGVAESLRALADGKLRRRHLRVLDQRLEEVTGRGGCHHPDGVAAMVESALRVFAADVTTHLRGRPCSGHGAPSVLPIPGGM